MVLAATRQNFCDDIFEDKYNEYDIIYMKQNRFALSLEDDRSINTIDHMDEIMKKFINVSTLTT